MCPFLLALPFFLQTVDGLRPGESVGKGAADLALAPTECVRGRVLDAVSANPLAGAEVELWTEGLPQAARCVSSARTRADGSFLLPRRESEQADKLILHAAGYRSTLVTRSDADEITLWPRAKHLGLRVVDLDGKPIAGARAETTQTCAHAPPAFVAESDASGAFNVATFPPLVDGPELFIVAQGYAAVLVQDMERMLSPGGLEVRLGRAPTLAFQIVDIEGRPLRSRRVCLCDEPYFCARTTDLTGRVEFAETASDFGVSWKIDHEGKAEDLAFGRIPTSFVPRLVFTPGGYPPLFADLDPAELVPVHVADAEGTELKVPVAVFHDRGSQLDSVEALHKDWRHVKLVAGGAFSGFEECVREVETPVETTLRLTREPELTLHFAGDSRWDVILQAGNASMAIGIDDSSGPSGFPVPRGQPLTIFAQSATERRLAHHAPIEQDTTLDMSGADSLLADARASEPPIVHRVSANTAGVRISLRRAHDFPDCDEVHGAFEFEALAHSGFEGRASADGCVSRALGPWDPPALELDLRHRGSLTVHADLVALYAGGGEGSATPGGMSVDDLAPGPLLAQLVLRDGRVLELSLVLRDGEERVLTVH